MVRFSVVIATRNRPLLFREALSSVLSQTCDSFEVIVVNDGSDEEHLSKYREAIEASSRPVQFHSLVRRPNGHGQSYAVNFGAALAVGDYLCFLDDDDTWTDEQYLSRVHSAITQLADETDLIFSNQAAFHGDQRKEGPIWLEGLAARLEASARRHALDGFYRVTVDDLLASSGFCHMNTMIVRRVLFDSVKGMDEGIRWECDHDLFLRLIDRAKTMLLSPSFVARHNIPETGKAASMTTSLSELERRLYQIRVFDKASLFAERRPIREDGQLCKGYTLKHIAEALASQGRYKAAAFYAREALGAAPTLKWTCYWWYLLLMTFRERGGSTPRGVNKSRRRWFTRLEWRRGR